MVCKICGKDLKSMFPHHLKTKHNLEPKDYYDTYVEPKIEHNCICGNPTSFINVQTGYRQFCCQDCARKNALIKTKEKYGVSNISQVSTIKNKMKKSIKQNWDNLSKEEKQIRCKNISIGTSKNMSKAIDKYMNDIKQFCIDNDCVKVNDLILQYGSGWYQAKIIKDLLYYKGRYLVKTADISKIEDYCKFAGRSFKENELYDYLTSIYKGTIIKDSRSIIAPFELDFYIPNKNLAIEFNGTYYHSCAIDNSYGDKNYHFNKSKLCEEKGIRLIHIYEWELNEPYWSKIQMMLKEALGISNKIYARQCQIKQITNQDAKILNEKVHLQGHRNAQITYGLFYKDQLVQLMSFSQTKYNKNLKNDNEWEIIRGCPGSNTSVIGGVSKLISHFIKDYKPSKIFSYCDFNKFSGTSYEVIGMNFIGYTGPDKTWIIKGQPIKRSPSKYKILKSKADAIMWGSGSKKYELNIKD